VFFVYGGRTSPNATSCTASSLFAYSFVNKNWTEYNSSAVKPLEGATLINYNDNALYLFGGSASCQNNPGDDIYRFSITDGRWDNGPIAPTNGKPPARAFHSAFLSNGEMYIFGGEAVNGPLSDVWAYNISGNTWRQVMMPNAPTSRSRVASASVMNRFFIYGGQGSSTTLASESYNDLWQLVVQRDCFNKNCMTCVATTNAGCGWCPDNTANYQCIAGSGSSPYVPGTCQKIENFSTDTNDCPETGFPSWAIALIVIGGVVLIGIIVFAIMKFREKNEYQEIR